MLIAPLECVRNITNTFFRHLDKMHIDPRSPLDNAHCNAIVCKTLNAFLIASNFSGRTFHYICFSCLNERDGI